MAIGRRLRTAFFGLLIVVGILLWIAALLLFSRVAENSDDFARYWNLILLINVIGIAVLVTLIVTNLVRLIRDYRLHVPGTRLKARMVGLLIVLAITPLAIVYMFSVAFINRGIDDWFSVDVVQGLENALELSRTALELQRRENLEELHDIASQLDTSDPARAVRDLGELRRRSKAFELTIFSSNSQVLATSSDDPAASVPSYPGDEIIFQLRQGRPYVALDLSPEREYQVLAAVQIPSQRATAEFEVLRGKFPVEQRISALANEVQASYNQFGELTYLRTGLKYSFTLVLSLVLLISMLASVYGAFFSARRLTVPIQQLMQGTRAVARGDFDTKLPTPALDEIGFLVNSFNDMTQRLAATRQEARLSEQQVESERHKLEVILARLSTGVVSLEADLRIRTANEAAGAILGVDLESHIGESLVDLADGRPLLGQLLAVSKGYLDRGISEWREQLTLRGEVGRRVLMCACTELPPEGDNPRGYVIVFDDITALVQAQRDAAWGEVARRLAHEIKNPLTPIRLSAERLRRRYLTGHSGDLDLLDRATHTIIQQVEAMKEMVNAFSQYARAPEVELSRFDLNKLIGEVMELYRHGESPVAIKLMLDSSLPQIEADVGRMRQVFHNLMRNSLEAMENQADAKVEISTRKVASNGGTAIEITVSDNGPGFAENLMHQAFDPYVTSKPKGTGLGLAIVKKLIEEHGGHIRAANGERVGAQISILLPVSGGSGDVLPSTHQDNNRRERA
jgi:nitrogen fixation/metabolism regulation signal transduction histidine kinase